MEFQNPKSKIQNAFDAPTRYAIAGVFLSLVVMAGFTLTGPKRFPETPFRPELDSGQARSRFSPAAADGRGRQGRTHRAADLSGQKNGGVVFRERAVRNVPHDVNPA